VRIAILHNVYGIRGGEERTVEFEHALLEAAGHDVHRYEVRNEDVLRGWNPAALGAALRAPWNRESYRRVRRWLEECRPDVMHVHNWFPLLSPSVYAAGRDLGIPVVQTLHNYRLGCASGLLLRDGRVCELCIKGNRRPAMRHGCYRGSSIQTSVWAKVMQRGWSREVFSSLVDAYIAPSRIVAEKHVEMGLPADRVHVIQHACDDPFAGKETRPTGSGAIFVGRLMREKGVDTLIRAWRGIDHPLKIVGTGTEENEFQELASDLPQVKFLGFREHDEVLRLIGDSAFLIFPSRWLEPFGLGMIEAMAGARPVVATRIGAAAELVEDGVNGLLVPPDNPRRLAEAAGRLLQDPGLCRGMGRSARRRYLDRFTPEIHRDALVRLYERTIRARLERTA